MLRSRNYLDPMGLAILMIGFWSHFILWHGWIIMAIGGVIYTCSLFFPREPDYKDLTGKEFLSMLAFIRAPLGLRALYYALAIGVVLTVIFFERIMSWYILVGILAYGIFFACVQNWYRNTYLKTVSAEGGVKNETAVLMPETDGVPRPANKQSGLKEVLRALTLPGAPVWVKVLVILCDVGLILAAFNYQRLGGFFLPVLALCVFIQAPFVRKYWPQVDC